MVFMRKTTAWNCVIAMLFFVTSAFAYDVVLKNGKVVKGDLLSQDDTLIVLKDASGVKIQLKKSTVDLPKTDAANPPAPTGAASTTPPSTPEKSEPKAEKPKQPARVYTLQDIETMREKHNLGLSPTSDDDSAAETSGEKPPDQQATGDAAKDKAKAEKDAAKAAEEKQKKIEALQKKIADTQNAYDALTKQCEYLKTKNFQSDRIYDEKGNLLPFFDTIKKTCDDADKAKSILDDANAQLQQLQ